MKGQPELASLEAFLEAEAGRQDDAFHIARWVVPLVLSVVGVSVFLPLALIFDPLFILGAVGMVALGGTLGMIFHRIAKSIPISRINLCKRAKLVLARLLRFRSLLGLEPALSPKVGEVLDQAARLYLIAVPEPEVARASGNGVWSQARIKATRAMEEAMARMLELAEPESAQAQEFALARGWAQPLLSEMEALAKAIQKHDKADRRLQPGDEKLEAISGLRDARSDLERLEEAVAELEIQQPSA